MAHIDSRNPQFGHDMQSGTNYTDQSQGAQQFAPNPTNPSPYNYQWGQQNINNYLSTPFTNPSSQDPLSFLSSQGINVSGLDDTSLAFLPDMDQLNTAFNRMNTQVGMARTGLGFDIGAQQLAGQQNLLGMSGGQGLVSMQGIGGASANRLLSGLGSVGDQYRTGLNQSIAGFQSDILGSQYDFQDSQSQYKDALTTALGNIMASGEDDFRISLAGADSANQINNPNESSRYYDDMTNYYDTLYS
jgi:hypothetical protein